MKTDKFYKSIVFKLIAAVVVIFIAMISISNYLINLKQIQMTDELLRDIQRWMPTYRNSVVVTVNNAHLQSTADFRIYTFLIMGLVLIVGSLIFAILISKILAPLKDLQKNISKIDINRPETFAETTLVEGGASEIMELSRAFNALMDRIYNDYRRQKDFSSNVAHELRTPVAVMKAQVDVFSRKNTDPETDAFIERIDDSLEKLNSLIEAVLLLSSKQKVNISEVSLPSVIDEILFDLDDRIIQKDISINYEIADDVILQTDDALIQRLLFNIIENAIKYNIQDGFIDISIEEHKKDIEVTIADSGIGMDDIQKQKVFDLFYQADGSRNKEGFGIGLSLSKQIAQSLGASIIIEDNLPQGSKFIIKFPKSLH